MQFYFDLALWFKSQGMKEPPTCITEIGSVAEVLKAFVTSQYPAMKHQLAMQSVAHQLLNHPNVVFVGDKAAFDNAFVFADKTRIHLSTVNLSYEHFEKQLAARMRMVDEESGAYLLVRSLYSDEDEMRVMYCEVTRSIVPMETYIRQFTIDEFLAQN